MRRIGVLTSGGDCAGLNACIRAVVRTALTHSIEVIGIRRGYSGLIAGESIPLNGRSVSGLINQGGTLLRTARNDEFRKGRGIQKACRTISKLRLDGLIILGGNGSLKGAGILAEKTPAAIVGIPKSIDNDIGGTDFSIGFDTAVNTAVGVIDKIRDTATSHERVFLVETMGRKRGFLALASAIAGGAEGVLLPEVKNDFKKLHQRLQQGEKHGKVSSIIVVAEGEEAGGAFKIAKKLKNLGGYDIRVAVIGHQQRGGAPSSADRILASGFGNLAVEALLRGERTKMTAIRNGQIVLVPLEFAWKIQKPLDANLLRLSDILSQ